MGTSLDDIVLFAVLRAGIGGDDTKWTNDGKGETEQVDCAADDSKRTKRAKPMKKGAKKDEGVEGDEEEEEDEEDKGDEGDEEE
jgi:hypothetical protein